MHLILFCLNTPNQRAGAEIADHTLQNYDVARINEVKCVRWFAAILE